MSGVNDDVIVMPIIPEEALFGEDADLRGRVERAANAAKAEVMQASLNWPAFNSAHEAWAVLTEEYKELTDHVFLNQKKRDYDEMRKEAVQVAAMALRFIVDICDTENRN